MKNEKMKLYKNMDYALKGERGEESSKGGPREGGGGGKPSDMTNRSSSKLPRWPRTAPLVRRKGEGGEKKEKEW